MAGGRSRRLQYFKSTVMQTLSHTQQFYFEYQGRTAWDARLRELSVAHFGRNVKFPLVTHVHLLHGNNPAINQVAQSHGEWRTATAGIKLLAVDGPTGIMGRHDAASARLCSLRVTLLQHLIIYTTRHTSTRQAAPCVSSIFLRASW